VHAPCGSRPVQASDITLLNAPRGYIIDASSNSHESSLFFWKTGSGHGVGVGATPEESSSVSIGVLWNEINSTGDAVT
jgi:hypothetical protein